MVVFHTGVKEKPCVNSNITSGCEEDAQASVGSQKEDIDPQFKISTWFKTPLFYQVVICDKVFKNGLSRIYAKQPFKICSNMICLKAFFHKFYFVYSWISWPICFFKALFVTNSWNLFFVTDLYAWFSVNFFSEIYRVVYITGNVIDNMWCFARFGTICTIKKRKK